MGNRSAKADKAEVATMRKCFESAYEAGAAGWSTGLMYFPGKFSDTAELNALSELTRGTRRVYATHLRSEGDDLISAVKEAAEIAHAGSGLLQLSHRVAHRSFVSVWYETIYFILHINIYESTG